MTFAEAADRLDKEFAYINGCYVNASRPDHEITDAELDVEDYDEALEIAIKLLRESDPAKGVECVTAASTIAALEEAGEKWRAKNLEIVKKQVVNKCVEAIKQVLGEVEA